MSNTNLSSSAITVDNLTPETVQAVLRELALVARRGGQLDEDELGHLADVGGHSVIAFQVARRLLEAGFSLRELLSVCETHVERAAEPLRTHDDALMLGKVRGIFGAICDGAFGAICDGAFGALDFFGKGADNEVEVLRAAIRAAGDDSMEWRVMAWVELAEAAAVAFSNANHSDKVQAVAYAVKWIADGLVGHEQRLVAGAFVEDLRALSTSKVGA